MIKDIYKKEKLRVLEYVPFECLTDDLYRELSKGSKVSLIDSKGILAELIIEED